MRPIPRIPVQLNIGSHKLENAVVLAPMSGVTDLPFRSLALRLGAGLVVSEMVASEELVQQRPDAAQSRRDRHVTVRHPACGREVRWMAEGARIAEDPGPISSTLTWVARPEGDRVGLR